VKRQANIFLDIDWIAVILYLLLIAFGWLNIFAVNYSPADGSFFSLGHRYTIQLLWIFISFLIVLFIFILDGRFFSFVAYPVYGLGIFMLLLVLVIGTVIHASKSWIVIGPISIQPSEFAKFATILALAKYLSGFSFKITRTKDILITLLIAFFPALLIMAQPDFGSTVVFGILILVLFREGLPGGVLIFVLASVFIFLGTLMLSQFAIVAILLSIAVIIACIVVKRPNFIVLSLSIIIALTLLFSLLAYINLIPSDKYLILIFILVSLCIISVIYGFRNKLRIVLFIVALLIVSIGFTYTVDYVFHNVMKEHQRNRVNVMLGLQSDPYGYEYNLRQSKIAIGSGGFAGKGFMQGTQTKFRFVPEQSTDFIFCTVGEEWGFLGSFGLIVVYVGLLIRLLVLAERQRSKFSRIYGYGVVSILFFHFAVNLGMTIGLFPVIGIPLPFLSYGGSSFLTFTAMLFIFIRLDSSRKTYLL
jgi:rod shape determining protein RodA